VGIIHDNRKDIKPCTVHRTINRLSNLIAGNMLLKEEKCQKRFCSCKILFDSTELMVSLKLAEQICWVSECLERAV